MNIIRIILTLIVLSSSIFGQGIGAIKKSDYGSLIIGEWEGYNSMFQGTVRFSFKKDKTGEVKAIGGNSFDTRYFLDTSVAPIALKIAIDAVNGDMHAIIAFLSVDSLKIKMSADNNAATPMSFSNPDDNETVVFRRIILNSPDR